MGQWHQGLYCPPHLHHRLIIYPLSARVVGAPRMISQPLSYFFPCSPLPSGSWRNPGLCIPRCCLPTYSQSLSFTRTPTVCPLTEVPLSFLYQNSHCLSLTRTPIVCPLPELQWSVLYQNSHSLFFIRTPIVVFVFECSK